MFRKMSRKTSKSKLMNKDQEETENRPGSLDPKSMCSDITLLINERTYLQEEVRNLKESLDNEHIRYTELKTLKSQQVCALTFKLAKAIRDKERVMQERDELNDAILPLQERVKELENRNNTLQNTVTSLEKIRDSLSTNRFNEKPSSLSKISIDALARFMKAAYSNGQANTMENNRSQGGEPGEKENHEKFLKEFREIQQELSTVKENMSFVQELNERLSNDLKTLREKAQGTKHFPEDCTDGGSLEENEQETTCVPDDCTDGYDQEEMVQATTRIPDICTGCGDQEIVKEVDGTVTLLEGSNDLNNMLDESIEMVNSNGLMSDSGNFTMTGLEQDVDLKKQIDKAMKELEDLRADNQAIKEQINKMNYVDHEDFLRKTTDFTGKMLQEMKHREEKRKTSASSYHSAMETDDIIKVVDHMTYEPDISPTIPRPQSACLLSSQSAFNPVPQRSRTSNSSPAEDIRRTTHGKLSDASLYSRKPFTSAVDNLRKISAPLDKEWKSSDSLYQNPDTFFNGRLGYKDYIHRHIVTSSSDIAKIRDLKPEEQYEPDYLKLSKM